ncbi:MAG: type II toxin-antitoxin system VapC family toxin [Deltaproteobacteria bacterium]|nr:type II toxin-antitoxin system VapC family toxin [Deltaproteobacteria bacterium]
MSLYVLDTDILSLYRHGHAEVVRHTLTHPSDALATTVITIEEQLSGWYTLLRRTRNVTEMAHVYDRLADTVAFLSSVRILSFTQPAITHYEQLHSLKLRMGTMDLRIAAITLAHNATLVTRNVQDFQLVPDLQIENWTM